MDIATGLSTLKGDVKKKVVEAVDDMSQLTALVKLLEEIERDGSILGQLERNLTEYDRRFGMLLNGETATAQTPKLDFTGSKKQLANSARRAFAQVHGLTQVKGVVYANGPGSTFGIAMASELRGGNKWWLGLPDQQFRAAVLLCQDGGGCLEFVLPTRSLGAIWSQLTRSAGQVHFDIKRDNLKYVLLIPRQGTLDITSFLRDYSPLAD